MKSSSWQTLEKRPHQWVMKSQWATLSERGRCALGQCKIRKASTRNLYSKIRNGSNLGGPHKTQHPAVFLPLDAFLAKAILFWTLIRIFRWLVCEIRPVNLSELGVLVKMRNVVTAVGNPCIWAKKTSMGCFVYGRNGVIFRCKFIFCYRESGKNLRFFGKTWSYSNVLVVLPTF